MTKINKTSSIAELNGQPKAITQSQQELRATLTVKETAALLGCSIRHTYKMAYAHQIPSAKQLGSKWIISKAAISRWLEDTPVVNTSDKVERPWEKWEKLVNSLDEIKGVNNR